MKYLDLIHNKLNVIIIIYEQWNHVKNLCVHLEVTKTSLFSTAHILSNRGRPLPLELHPPAG